METCSFGERVTHDDQGFEVVDGSDDDNDDDDDVEQTRVSTFSATAQRFNQRAGHGSQGECS